MTQRNRWSTIVIFLIVGTAVGCWAPMVPLAKERLHLSEEQLGAVLLALGLGSIVAMPFSGGLAQKFGCRKLIMGSAAVALFALGPMATSGSAVELALALFVFGAGIGVTDVAMNIQAVAVEKGLAKPMMSGFHAMYSAGGILGAAGTSFALSMDATPYSIVLGLGILSYTVLIGFGAGLLPYGSEEKSKAFALPRGRLLAIGMLCFALFLAEGCVLDWSGVLLTTQFGLDTSRAGIAYASFAAAITVGRLLGDRIVHRFGASRVLVSGCVLASAGYLVAAFTSDWALSTVGFVLVGIGATNVVPVLFTEAGRDRTLPSNLAIAAVTTMGYAGILAGPAAIGFLASGIGLQLALAVVAFGLAVSAVVAGLLRVGNSPEAT